MFQSWLGDIPQNGEAIDSLVTFFAAKSEEKYFCCQISSSNCTFQLSNNSTITCPLKAPRVIESPTWPNAEFASSL
jgi:hypothetical protein